MADLTITDIGKPEYKYSSIWVLNITKKKRRGQITFRVPEMSGGEYAVITVPDTFIPIDLITKVTREQLLQSIDFRPALNSGLLKMIKNKEAQEILSRPGVEEELERLRDDAEKVGAQRTSMFGVAASMEEQVPIPQQRESFDEAPSVSSLHSRVNAAGVLLAEEGEVRLINKLRAVQGELTDRDYSHLQGLAQETSSSKLLEYVKNRMDEN